MSGGKTIFYRTSNLDFVYVLQVDVFMRKHFKKSMRVRKFPEKSCYVLQAYCHEFPCLLMLLLVGLRRIRSFLVESILF